MLRFGNSAGAVHGRVDVKILYRHHRLPRPVSAASAMIGFRTAFWSGPAAAYRPFDGTDAAVADLGQVEIELQPAGVLHAGSG